MTRLAVDADELASCVSCGLCLPHCPTYRVTGEETASPRGRIAAMRAVDTGAVPADATFARVLDLCVQCRGCETACPSGVPFGHLVEGARRSLPVPLRRRLALAVVASPHALRAASVGLAVAQRAGVVPSRLGLPRVPLRRPSLRSSGRDVWLFPGCVMDAWMRPVHLAVLRVLEAAGAGVAVPEGAAPCCGALHAHAGLGDAARRLAARTMAAFPGDAPILVDAAGCGAQLKDYGRLLGTADGAAFSGRVLDVHEWLAARPLPDARGRRYPSTVAVQDPCHLRHVQRAHEHVRTVLAPYADVVELDDEGLCCGAGGAYAAVHPDMAGAIRDRKVAAVARTGAPIVVSANPGCAMHLGAAGLDVRHPLEIVDEVLHGR